MACDAIMLLASFEIRVLGELIGQAAAQAAHPRFDGWLDVGSFEPPLKSGPVLRVQRRMFVRLAKVYGLRISKLQAQEIATGELAIIGRDYVERVESPNEYIDHMFWVRFGDVGPFLAKATKKMGTLAAKDFHRISKGQPPKYLAGIV